MHTPKSLRCNGGTAGAFCVRPLLWNHPSTSEVARRYSMVKSRETAMVEPQDKAEAAWRAEFKRMGEAQLRDALNSSMLNDESKRQAALRWLGDETQALRLHEDQTSHYVRWTFLVAVAVVIVGVISVGLTLLH